MVGCCCHLTKHATDAKQTSLILTHQHLRSFPLIFQMFLWELLLKTHVHLVPHPSEPGTLPGKWAEVRHSYYHTCFLKDCVDNLELQQWHSHYKICLPERKIIIVDSYDHDKRFSAEKENTNVIGYLEHKLKAGKKWRWQPFIAELAINVSYWEDENKDFKFSLRKTGYRFQSKLLLIF